jgi:hypothetical protein
MFLHFRRSYKVCDWCGHFARGDALYKAHISKCQPGLKEWENGFLRAGFFPKTRVDEFRCVFRIMAFDDKHLKHQEHAPTDEVENLSNSDHSSEKSQLPFQDVQEQRHCYSQDSFGGTSQISSATVAQEMPSQQSLINDQCHIKLLSKPGLTSFFEP